MIITNTFGVQLYYMVTASAAPSGWSEIGSITPSGSATISGLSTDMYYQVSLSNVEPVTYGNSLTTAGGLSSDATVSVTCSALFQDDKKK